MTDIIQKYNQLCEEVMLLNDYYMALSAENEKVKNLYKGCKILFSDLKVNPQVLLIGINPGPGGYDAKTGSTQQQFEPLKTLEYNYCNYTLAKETKDVFFMAGLTDVLSNNCIKTNLYYFATSKESDLYTLFGHGPWSETNSYKMSYEWTFQLIDMIKPKLIVCEGKSVFDKLVELISGKKINWNGNNVAVYKEYEYPIIGYARRLSRIKDKPMLANSLKELLCIEDA